MFKVTKAVIGLYSCDETNFQRSEEELDSLMCREPPIADIAALLILEYYYDAHTAITEKMGEGPRFQTMWERAVTLQPKDEALYDLWFKRKFLALKWSASQKVRTASIPALKDRNANSYDIGSHEISEYFHFKSQGFFLGYMCLSFCRLGQEFNAPRTRSVF